MVEGLRKTRTAAVYFLLRRWTRVRLSSLRCFFLAIRLRRFLITEPTTTLAHFFSLVRGVWAHTTYVGLAYPPELRACNPRLPQVSPEPHSQADSTPT